MNDSQFEQRLAQLFQQSTPEDSSSTESIVRSVERRSRRRSMLLTVAALVGAGVTVSILWQLQKSNSLLTTMATELADANSPTYWFIGAGALLAMTIGALNTWRDA